MGRISGRINGPEPALATTTHPVLLTPTLYREGAQVGLGGGRSHRWRGGSWTWPSLPASHPVGGNVRALGAGEQCDGSLRADECQEAE